MIACDKYYVGFIYCLTNLVNGKCYIGQTMKSVHTRWLEHQWYAKKNADATNIVLYRAINKYGAENFNVAVIKIISRHTRDELKDALNKEETASIREYDTLKPKGYNMNEGGYEPVLVTRVPIYCFDMDGNYICKYPSMCAAERATGIGHTLISRACNPNITDRGSAGGFLWSKTMEAPVYNFDQGAGHRRPVRQMDKNGNIIKEFKSITDAANELGIHISLVYKCCIGERKSTGGYRWSFINEK